MILVPAHARFAGLAGLLAMFGGAAAGCGQPCETPSSLPDLGYAPSEVFPLERADSGRPLVAAATHAGELRLVFDTNNMAGLALTAAAAERSALTLARTERDLDAAGRPLGESRVWDVPVMRALGREWTGLQAHELRSDAYHGRAEGDGLLGAALLLDRRFTLDQPGRGFGVSESSMPDFAGPGLELVRVDDLDGYLLVHGRLAGRDVLVNLDTGKTRTVVDAAFAQDPALRRDPKTGQVDVKVGGATFFPTLNKQDDYSELSRRAGGAVALSLGHDMLDTVVLTVDWRAGRVWLGSPPPNPER